MKTGTPRILESIEAADFRRLLLDWYDTHARELPWRRDRDPYRVWVSEIMLQQTRVAAVIEHYHEFLRRFPTVQRLAAARESSVLAAWSGLGYYRRARMLHRAAKMVARERGGEFPETSSEWRQLPGIGRYTAAAVSSIAFGEAVAVVDGNVERVLQRISGTRLSNGEFWYEAGELLDPQRPGDFNQAMMELGATVCTPRAPVCLTCPVVQLCSTRGELRAQEVSTPQIKRVIDLALHRRKGGVYLVQRAADARLMPGMWELPEFARTTHSRQLHKEEKSNINPVFTVRHSITVTDYTVRVWECDVARTGSGRWVSNGLLPRTALTGLTRKVLRKAGLSVNGMRPQKVGSV